MPSKFPCFGQKKLKYNITYPCSNGFLQSFIKLRSQIFNWFRGLFWVFLGFGVTTIFKPVNDNLKDNESLDIGGPPI